MHPVSLARRTALVGAVTAAVTAGTAGAAAAAVVHGTVVHHNNRAHSFVVADKAGHLWAIHASHSPRIGSVVAVSTRWLRNGTYAARWTHTLGAHRGRVRLHGVVSYVDRRHGTFTLSARGVSMLVRTHRSHLARAADALPPVGSDVTVTGNVDDQGDVNDDTTQVVGQDQNGFDLEGTILSVDTAARTITVSSTDDDQTANSVTVSVPSTLDISMFSTGQEVELTVTQQPDGSLVLSGSADDQGQHGANDQGEQQGDQGDDGGRGGPGSGSDGSGSGSDGSGSGSGSGTTSGSTSSGGTE